jgi:COP9 signalosome complex subunit 5
MTQLMDSMELRRKEGFVGWYHSHPFDVETYTHCHLSAIDVQTQTGWQMASGAWTSVVVDPLRSLAKQEPEIGVYRVYPPKYNPPVNECPDGSINADVSSRTTRWGLSYHRYYQLRASYFMSGLGNQMLEVMSKNALWVRVLGSSSIMEPDNRERFADRIKKAAERLQNVDVAALVSTSSAASAGAGGSVGPAALMGGMGSLGMMGGGGARSGRRRRAGGDGGASDELTKGAQACCELATEQCKGHSSQIIKDLLFNYIRKQEVKMEQIFVQAQQAQAQPQAMQVDG